MLFLQLWVLAVKGMHSSGLINYFMLQRGTAGVQDTFKVPKKRSTPLKKKPRVTAVKPPQLALVYSVGEITFLFLVLLLLLFLLLFLILFLLLLLLLLLIIFTLPQMGQLPPGLPELLPSNLLNWPWSPSLVR